MARMRQIDSDLSSAQQTIEQRNFIIQEKVSFPLSFCFCAFLPFICLVKTNE